MMKLAKCKRNLMCKVKIEDDNSKEATIFVNVLTKLIGPISSSIADADILGSANPEAYDQRQCYAQCLPNILA